MADATLDPGLFRPEIPLYASPSFLTINIENKSIVPSHQQRAGRLQLLTVCGTCQPLCWLLAGCVRAGSLTITTPVDTVHGRAQGFVVRHFLIVTFGLGVFAGHAR